MNSVVAGNIRQLLRRNREALLSSKRKFRVPIERLIVPSKSESLLASSSGHAYLTTCKGGSERTFQSGAIVKTARKKMTKLTEAERHELLDPLISSGWAMASNRDAIEKEFVFEDFCQAFSFMTSCAMNAHKCDHHPEWFNVYNKVKVTLQTHDVDGISSKDISSAKFIDKAASACRC